MRTSGWKRNTSRAHPKYQPHGEVTSQTLALQEREKKKREREDSLSLINFIYLLISPTETLCH